MAIRRPCKSCGSVDTKRYFRQDSQNYRPVCAPCLVGITSVNREKRRKANPGLVKEKARLQRRRYLIKHRARINLLRRIRALR